MAPPGWLLLQKGAVLLLGEGEHALRLVPLLGSLVTLPLCWHVARRILRPGVGPPHVYYGAEKAFVYYARRYGFAPDTYVLGDCARDDLRLYLRELDAFRGAPRVWLVMAHASPELEEDTAILAYLDRIGTRKASFQAGGVPGRRSSDRARVDLYDLSDGGRLASVTRETFSLPPRAQGGRAAAWSCHPGA